ncbi:hypothetical protein, partial [Amycolatopsis sp. cmx-4-68]|uniref:hypothetical protein n=1 Tax=Amycolatopsis sp. cmx-4-68 TaxID=2790938 RepID=UPI00397DAD6B
MWQYALWGAIGSAANMGVGLTEALSRAKGRPWVRPYGPGGGAYTAMVLINLGVAASVTAALSTATMVTNSLVAFGIGAAAPAAVKKVSNYALVLQRQSGEWVAASFVVTEAGLVLSSTSEAGPGPDMVNSVG